jgi:hypothetical protein
MFEDGPERHEIKRIGVIFGRLCGRQLEPPRINTARNRTLAERSRRLEAPGIEPSSI